MAGPLRTPHEVLAYFMEIANRLSGSYNRKLPTPAKVQLVVENGAGKTVTVYADNKRVASVYDVFILTNTGPSGPLQPGEATTAEIGGGQTSSGDAAEVAGEIQRFLDVME